MFFYLFIFFILGSIVGSFINCLSWRLAHNKKIVFDRSECPQCKTRLKWWENIPIFSFLILRGKCFYCKAKIPFDHFLTEFCAGLLFIWVFWFNARNVDIIDVDFIKIFFELFIVSFLLFIFLHDLLYKIILPGAVWLGLIVVLFFNFSLKVNFLDILWGAILGFVFFAFQYVISKGKWIGGGDVRYGLFMGALLGISKTVVALLCAYWLGALISLFLLIFKKKKIKSEIPFGTFLTIGTLLAIYFGEDIIKWYMKIVG